MLTNAHHFTPTSDFRKRRVNLPRGKGEAWRTINADPASYVKIKEIALKTNQTIRETLKKALDAYDREVSSGKEAE